VISQPKGWVIPSLSLIYGGLANVVFGIHPRFASKVLRGDGGTALRSGESGQNKELSSEFGGLSNVSAVSGVSRRVVGTVVTTDMVLGHICFPIMYIEGCASGAFSILLGY
jgi:hypothetical protein